MDKFVKHVLPHLEDEYIRYFTDGGTKLMSADYFRKNFKNLAATELPNIGQQYFYYQNTEDPDLVIRFRISQHIGVSAALMPYSDFENQVKVMNNL